MPFTDASAYLTQFRTQLAACAAWTAGSSAIHYPEIDWASVTLPVMVVAEESRGSEQYASGAVGLRTGTLKAVIYSSGTIGAVEVLADSIIEQMLAQQSGIPIRGATRGLCGDATDAMIAASGEVRGVEIMFEYGLNG